MLADGSQCAVKGPVKFYSASAHLMRSIAVTQHRFHQLHQLSSRNLWDEGAGRVWTVSGLHNLHTLYRQVTHTQSTPAIHMLHTHMCYRHRNTAHRLRLTLKVESVSQSDAGVGHLFFKMTTAQWTVGLQRDRHTHTHTQFIDSLF